jgi:hypothetical protein
MGLEADIAPRLFRATLDHSQIAGRTPIFPEVTPEPIVNTNNFGRSKYGKIFSGTPGRGENG